MHHKLTQRSPTRQLAYLCRLVGLIACPLILASCYSTPALKNDTYFSAEAMRKLPFVEATILQVRAVKIRVDDGGSRTNSSDGIELTLVTPARGTTPQPSQTERKFIIVQPGEATLFFPGQQVRLVSSMGRSRVIPADPEPDLATAISDSSAPIAPTNSTTIK